ncbi:MAG: radical SAM protein [Desulfobacterales bacterium]|nr:radical SAM protein [Desulfobacterales bacterium]
MTPETNPESGLRLRVNEIFYSIQGESLHAGRPCIFVRLTGCNLRCSYCDTTYAYFEGRIMDMDEIVSKVAAYGCRLVEITGGEPLMQEQTPVLVDRLLASGLEVLMETNGTYPIDRVSPECIKIVDIKCPASGESEKTDFDNISRLKKQDQVKFVVCDRRDYEFARQVIERFWPGRPTCPVLISPAFGRLEPDRLAGWILEDRMDIRLQLQLHKIIWPHIQRGV